jgi:putative phosphotransacetylase
MMNINKWQIPVGVSNRHIHLTREHLEALFGEGYELTPLKELCQPGQYAAQETVYLVGPKNGIQGVRIIGPLRNITQVEIARTDSFSLGIKAPIRESGNIKGSPGCVLVGPKGTIILDEGVIIAERHIHLSKSQAQKMHLADKDRVSVIIDGERCLTFNNVLVRAGFAHEMEFHLDTDEANACTVNSGDAVEISIDIEKRIDLVV